jgi:TolB-like protein
MRRRKGWSSPSESVRPVSRAWSRCVLRCSALLGASLLLTVPMKGQTRSSVAVLPFENTGSYGQDKEVFQALELGIAAMLGSALAHHPALQAVEPAKVSQALQAQSASTARRVDASTAGQIGKSLGARYVITGSFADFYGKLRINARLVDAESGEILKVVSNADPKLQNRTELGAIIQDAAERIAAAIKLPPFPQDAAARGRSVPTEAITLFGRGLLYESQGDNAKAGDAYQRALDDFPSYDEARQALQRVRGP